MQHPLEEKRNTVWLQRTKGDVLQFWSWGYGWRNDAPCATLDPGSAVTYDETWCEPEDDADAVSGS